MKKNLVILIGLLSVCNLANAQFSKYIIQFADKGSTPYTLANPAAYLSQKAVENRAKYSIAIDSLDLPVTPRYIDSIKTAGNVTILSSSKWLNQVAIQTTDAAALAKINSFPFVKASKGIAAKISLNQFPFVKKLTADIDNTTIPTQPILERTVQTDSYDYGVSNGQVTLHQGKFLHNLGFRGEGMQMAILDAGFYRYTSLPSFDSIRLNNQILGTWDFVSNNTSVDDDHDHGMKCLSAIASNMPGTFVGIAPKTSFYLYRTEDVSSEYPIEEQNWVAGIERADSLGVLISSTSLGYNEFDNASLNYTYADMNGKTSISSKAANIAAKKGMLLFVAAGNTGNSTTWNQILTPSDAENIIAVGAVDTTGQVGSFSAYGPSSDGRIKPELAAVGWRAVVSNSYNGLPEFGNGTSYACPNLAGISTCLWQAFPEVNNLNLIEVLKKSASKYNTPDNRIGYGIPDMKKAFVLLVKQLSTQQLNINNCMANGIYSLKIGNDMSVEIERQLPGENSFSSIKSYTGTGNFAIQNFSFTDDISSANYGQTQYRLNMKIADTSFIVSTSSVQYTQNCLPTVDLIQVSPNPVIDNLKVTIHQTKTAKASIIIINSSGQKIFEKHFDQPAGYAEQIVSMRNLAKGMYVVSVWIDGKKTFSKQVVR